MKVCVTGATGFVGRQLVPRLTNVGHDVLAAVRRPVESGALAGVRHVLVGDLREGAWDEVLDGADAVIHLAARAHVISEPERDPLREFRDVNVRGTLRLAESARRAGVKRFIHMSSIGVLGNRTGSTPFSDRDVPAPVEHYAVSKTEAETALDALAANGRMEVVILRPPLVCGAGAPGNLRRLAALVSRGYPIPVPARPNRRSFLGISSLVDAIIRCLSVSGLNRERLVLADDEVMSTDEVLHALARGMGRRLRTARVPDSILKLGSHLVCKRELYEKVFGSLEIDAARAKGVLGWRPIMPTSSSLEVAGRMYLEKPGFKRV